MPISFGSKEEERVYISHVKLLKKHRILGFDYQVPILGGRSVRGGFVVDFVARTPFEQPEEVFGNYWHKGELRGIDRLRLAAERQEFGVDPIIYWGNELPDQETTDRVVTKRLL